jgi:benzylsuccinate CoA-transferase BbsF subunit
MTEEVFSGVRIAAFCWGIAGPLTVKYLADHGAEVIHIESSKRIDMVRLTAPYKAKLAGVNRSLFFADYNENQYSITLNLKRKEGLEVAKKIIARSDVVVESMLPGAMKKLGLGYEEIRRVKPDVVMLSTCNQGQTGPDARRKGFGTQLTASAGFAHMTGYPERPPVVPGMMGYTDVCSARLGATALIAALCYRQRTGKGEYIDLSQFEAGVFFLSSQVLNFTINSRIGERAANRSERGVPHGAYPCKGRDNWCVIAIYTEKDWRKFCNALNKQDWLRDPRFFTFAKRKENEGDLDKEISAVTANLSAYELMTELQSHGVIAGVVQNSQDLYDDPQLGHRSHFRLLKHSEIGQYRCDVPAFRLSKTPHNLRMAAPCLGQHNHYVCTEILGMSDQEFLKLSEYGILQ